MDRGSRQRRALALGRLVQERLDAGRAELEEESRRHAAAVAAGPPGLVGPDGAVSPGPGEAVYGERCGAEWLHRLRSGFKWGLLLGLLVEAGGIWLLSLAGRQVRGAGL